MTDVTYPSTGFSISRETLTINLPSAGYPYPTLFYNIETRTVRAACTYHYPPNENELCLLKISGTGDFFGILATQLLYIKETQVRNILEVTKIIPEKEVIRGTIYNGNLITGDPNCLSSGNYISVNGEYSIEVPHASDLTVRVTEYDANKTYIRNTGTYSDVKYLTLQKATRYIRIGASYTSRGYSSSNPISADAYQEGDFDVILNRSTVIDDIIDKENELEKRVSPLESLTLAYEKGVYSDVTKAGQGTTWLFFDFYVSEVCEHIITFLNDSTNGNPQGVNYLIYGDDMILIHGITGANIKAGTNKTIKAGYKHIQVQCRIASSESNTVRCAQISILEEIEKLQLPEVIQRNYHKEPAIRCAGKKSVNTDIKQFGFMHISDTHVAETDNRYKCLENARKVMDYYTNLKCCIITGDIVYDTFADPMTPYDKALVGSDKLFLNVIGNHDAGQENATVGYLVSVGTDEQVYNKFIAPYKDNWNLGDGDTGKNYYYKDFTEEKVRVVVLYDFETDFELNEEQTRLKYWREACTVRQAQVDWLISTLENTPIDYGVIVAHHINYKFDNSDNNFCTPRLKNATESEYQYSSDKQWLEKILTAYQNKTSVDITWSQTGGVVTSLTANHDFSAAGGEFICILAGHTHDDFIGHPGDFPNLVLLTVGSDNIHYTGNSCARAANHVSEDLINIVNVDRNYKTISVVRIGADFSVTGQKRDCITVSYATQ